MHPQTPGVSILEKKSACLDSSISLQAYLSLCFLKRSLTIDAHVATNIVCWHKNQRPDTTAATATYLHKQHLVAGGQAVEMCAFL